MSEVLSEQMRRAVEDPASLGSDAAVAQAEHLARLLTESITKTWQPPAEQLAQIRAEETRKLGRVSEAMDELRSAARAHDVSLEEGGGGVMSGDINKWFGATLAASKKARTMPRGIRQSTKRERARLVRSWASPLAWEYPALVNRIHADVVTEIDAVCQGAWERFSARLSAAADGARQDVQGSSAREGLRQVPWRNGIEPQRLSQPLVCPGYAGLLTIDASVSTSMYDLPAATVHASHNDTFPLFPVQILLDNVGGFVSDEKGALEAAAIDLLTQMPGGRVKVNVIDPMGMGDSAKFLFDLNDAGDKILADAVWTTSVQVAKLLTTLEEHVAFVTQKYLQGRQSLTEYNVAAGEIAESYQLVLLYDYPSVFSRDQQSWDTESMARLQKLASAGRRAGVYFFVHAPGRVTTDNYLSDLVDLRSANLPLPRTLQLELRTLRKAVGPTPGVVPEKVDVTFGWGFAPEHSPDPENRAQMMARLLQDLQHAQVTQVDPARVATLVQQKAAADQQKKLRVDPVVIPDDPDTWWQSTSIERIRAPFGRMGASNVASLEFNCEMESAALIGGRTGSGKSYLLHSLIMGLTTAYAPEELALYLIDLKEGVEFKQYADSALPHAIAIAIESSREFALSVLDAVDAEITRRGALFKSRADGAAVSFRDFRSDRAEHIPRLVVMIDEFHKLFEPDDKVARQATARLERLVKEGRAFGVHVVLASQTLANVDPSFRGLIGQIPYRLVLASSESDSRLLLGEDNSEAKVLTRAGEGILNAKGGTREANQRFQTTFWDPDYRAKTLYQLRQKATDQGFIGRPQVFEGRAEVSAADAPLATFQGPATGTFIPLGAPMSLDPPVSATLTRAPGGNLLLVDPAGEDMLAVACTSLLAQGVSTTLVDFSALQGEWEQPFAHLAAHGLTQVYWRRFAELLHEQNTEVQRRHADGSNGDYNAPPQVLVLAGLHRGRGIDPDDYDPDSLHQQLLRLAAEGPDVGVHVLAWVDRKASLERRASSSLVREFGLRVVGRCGDNDSQALIDTPLAAQISDTQVVFDDFDASRTVVVRRFAFPGTPWIDQVLSADG